MNVVSVLKSCGGGRLRFGKAFALMMLATCITGCHHKASSAGQAAPGQKTFASPADAGKALADAARSDDEQQMLAVFGAGAKDLLYSGDRADDKAAMASFVAGYDQMNRWRKLDNGNEILLVSATNVAFPVPLRKDGEDKWYFDTPAGGTELMVRRIGRNELAVIDIMASLADAQEEYYNQAHDGTKQYARRFISDPGKQNGLYWPPANGAKSPVGPLIAYATEQGVKLQPDLHKPFHGYYFGILVTQGIWANGGFKDYIRQGVMNRGFGFIAWPAEYGKSGVMTFMTNRDRLVYQKDLGEKTRDQAPFMTAFDLDNTWLRVEQ